MKTDFDPGTGEVLKDETSRGGWRKRNRTPEEVAAAALVREERAKLRAEEIAVLRAVDPACETDDDPPVAWRTPSRIGGKPAAVLLDLPRTTGRANSGSRLVLVPRSYDGAGPNGGDPHEYVSLFVIFHDRGGNPRRTVGVAIRSDELRKVAAALTKYAKQLDEHEAKAVKSPGRRRG